MIGRNWGGGGEREGARRNREKYEWMCGRREREKEREWERE